MCGINGIFRNRATLAKQPITHIKVRGELVKANKKQHSVKGL